MTGRPLDCRPVHVIDDEEPRAISVRSFSRLLKPGRVTPLASKKDRRWAWDRQVRGGARRERTGSPRARRSRRFQRGRPLEDPDAEAFCRIYARVVLRIKGLEGLPRSASAGEEVEHESA